MAINYTVYEYDDLGRLSTVTDAEGNVTTNRYYPDGKLWKTVDSENHNTVVNTYNSDGSLQKVEDASGHATQYTYTGFMELERTTFADSSYEELTYDPENRRLTQSLTRAGQTISFTYDDLNRLKTKTISDSLNPSFNNALTNKYDLVGRLLRTVDNAGTITNTYDLAGRLTQVQYPGSKTVSYQYDAASNRIRLTYPDSTYITYEYDAMKRLTKIRNQAGTILAQYTYDDLDRRTALAYANGASVDYAYDSASRVLDVNNVTNSGQLKYSYTYDDAGNRLSMSVTDSSGTKVHTYGYDHVYQLTDVNYPQDMSYLATDTTFNYDPVGNLTSVVDGSGTENYTTNNLNQYTVSGAVTHTYDKNGSMSYDGANSYFYDAENRLVKVMKAPTALSAACDAPMAFTTGGSANWASQTTETHYDRDAAKSGTITHSQETWMQTTVYGKGTLKFWWKVSSEANADGVKFYIDGQFQTSRSGTGATADWAEATYNVNSLGLHTLRWVYSKNASGSAGSDCAWVDQVQWTKTGVNSTSLQDALDVGWTTVTGGDGSWYRVTSGYYGGDSAHSGGISENQKSQMEMTVTGSGSFSFYWKVNSGLDADYLEFYIDGVRQDRISGNVNWQQKSYNLSAGTHSLLWQYIKDGDSGNNTGWDCGWVDRVQGPGTAPLPPDMLAEAVDLTSLAFTTGGAEAPYRQTSTYYSGSDAVETGDISDDEESWMQTSVQGAGTLTFYWKVSSQSSCDYLEFYLDNTLQSGRISGDTSWALKSYTITGTGTHTVKWRYVKDSSDESGSDCGWVDYVQWSGYMPPVYTPIPDTWDTVTYTYDAAGRRIAKTFDNQTCLKYIYDGSQYVAEYDGNNNLLRKYVYGPGIDQPICMIDVEHSSATHYYHFDALGSVVGLSNVSGNIAEVYEYSAYGQVGASDPNHLNLFMFTGREFDKESGLYYYRARFYSPEVGRFLQNDPVGYQAGMNLYRYCRNNPVNLTDPFGLDPCVCVDVCTGDPCGGCLGDPCNDPCVFRLQWTGRTPPPRPTCDEMCLNVHARGCGVCARCGLSGGPVVAAACGVAEKTWLEDCVAGCGDTGAYDDAPARRFYRRVAAAAVACRAGRNMPRSV